MKREWVGRGFLKYLLLWPDTREEQQRLSKERNESWNAAIKEGGGIFGALALPAETICRNTLERSGGPQSYSSGSPEGYAQDVLDAISAAKARIAEGEADVAAVEAWRAGVEWATAQLKFQWEDDALKERRRREESDKANPPGPTEKSQKVIAEMTRLKDEGRSISRAADLCAGKGIGTSKAANLKIWKRHAK